MKFFKSIDWFGSQERKALKDKLELLNKENEVLTEQSEILEKQRKILEGLSEAIEDVEHKKQMELNAKPYKNIYFSNGNITVVLDDNSVLSSSGVVQTTFEAIKEAKTKGEISELLTFKEKVEVKDTLVIDTEEEKQQIIDNLAILRVNPDFEIKDNKVYLKGVNLEMPSVVSGSFIQILEQQLALSTKFCFQDGDDEEGQALDEVYEALKMFWLKLALNGRESSRSDLLSFVKQNDVRITRNGNLILYRNLVSIGNTNKELTAFISQQYFKIKGFKKSPKSYEIYKEDNNYKLISLDKINNIQLNWEKVGNLYDLYTSLADLEENEFTSSHNKGKYTIKIGSIYKIEETDINLDNSICHSGGLICSPLIK